MACSREERCRASGASRTPAAAYPMIPRASSTAVPAIPAAAARQKRSRGAAGKSCTRPRPPRRSLRKKVRRRDRRRAEQDHEVVRESGDEGDQEEYCRPRGHDREKVREKETHEAPEEPVRGDRRAGGSVPLPTCTVSCCRHRPRRSCDKRIHRQTAPGTALLLKRSYDSYPETPFVFQKCQVSLRPAHFWSLSLKFNGVPSASV